MTDDVNNNIITNQSPSFFFSAGESALFGGDGSTYFGHPKYNDHQGYDPMATPQQDSHSSSMHKKKIP